MSFKSVIFMLCRKNT